MKNFSDFIVETTLNRINSHIGSSNIGMISASRAGQSAEERKSAHHALRGDIEKAGLGYISMKGAYTETDAAGKAHKVSEPSYMVFSRKAGDDSGHLKGFLSSTGEKYNQDSVLYKAHNDKNANLIGTTKNPHAFVKYGESHNVGEFHPNRAPEFHTMLRGRGGNKAFAFESYNVVQLPSFFNREETIIESFPL